MKRNYIRSFCLDEDTATAFNAAKDKLRMSGSEIVNRLLLEWILHKDKNTLLPKAPAVAIPRTMVQRATDISRTEKGMA